MQLHHDADAQETRQTPFLAPEGTWICSIDAYPEIPLPGANVFIASQDLSSREDADGNKLIHCQPIDTPTGLRDAYKGINILRRFIIP